MDDDRLARGAATQTAAAVRWSARQRRRLGRLRVIRPGQYHLDLVADAAALDVLHGAGLGVLLRGVRATGPTAAPGGGGRSRRRLDERLAWGSRGTPPASACSTRPGRAWPSSSTRCSGTRYTARRGGGAQARRPADRGVRARRVGSAVIGVSGLPAGRPPWWQTRALGAAALDLCLVAEGVLDGFSVGATSSLPRLGLSRGPPRVRRGWGRRSRGRRRELVIASDGPRRVVAAATAQLAEQLSWVLSSGAPESRASVRP